MASDNSQNSKRIAKNTLLLYVRMLFIMAVNLYMSRVVLNTLGVVDFGIYNVIAGVVAMFAIISGSLSAAISRFITFELGRGNLSKQKAIFSSSITIQVAIAVVILIVAELIGPWFLNNKMNIPADRILAANWVLQCTIFSFCFTLIGVPFNASIIAHEKMSAFAYISILEVLLKLAVVYALLISPIDKLISYAILLLVVVIFIQSIYGIYCRVKFEECRMSFSFDRDLLKKMTGFAGWNFIGSSASILRDQGVNIVINLFCGPVVNAARGVAMQICHAVTGFVNNFMTALNPQITKSYATGDFDYMNTLVFKGARFSFYLLLILSLPIFLETELIMDLWLKGMVPEHSIMFVRLILIFTLIESVSGPLITLMLATGNIKKYQIIAGGTNMMNLPISYILLRWCGFADFPEITFIVAIIISVLVLLCRLYLLKEMVNLDVQRFTKEVLVNVVLVSLISAFAPVCIHLMCGNSVIEIILEIFVCFIFSALTILFVGCNKEERAMIYSQCGKIRNKILSNEK